MATLQEATTKYIIADNGVNYAYRRVGSPQGVPLLMHIHFRANMDFWDPLLVNTLALGREVIIFDQRGIGRSSGEVPTSIAGWANDVISFIKTLQLDQIDLLGFSMGGYCVQMVTLMAPGLIRKLIIAGSTASAPSSEAESKILQARETAPKGPINKLRTAETLEEGKEALAYSFFYDDAQGRRAFAEYWNRLEQRKVEPLQLLLQDKDRAAARQIQASLDWQTYKVSPDNSKSFHRLSELRLPVLIANGDNDLLIPTSRSWELVTQINNAQLIIYPQSGHGFLWQYAERFAEDIHRFLDKKDLVAKI